jgi:hypothetical protein
VEGKKAAEVLEKQVKEKRRPPRFHKRFESLRRFFALW